MSNTQFTLLTLMLYLKIQFVSKYHRKQRASYTGKPDIGVLPMIDNLSSGLSFATKDVKSHFPISFHDQRSVNFFFRYLMLGSVSFSILLFCMTWPWPYATRE